MNFRITQKIKNYILGKGIENTKNHSYTMTAEVNESDYEAQIRFIDDSSIDITNLVRLEYCDADDSEEIEVVVKRVPTLVDESLILDFYCALVANAVSYGHTLKDVEDRFDKLGFIVKIIESTNHFEVTVHNSILIKLDREYLEESLIIQRGNLFDAFMAAILAKLLWHDKDVVKLKGYYDTLGGINYE